MRYLSKIVMPKYGSNLWTMQLSQLSQSIANRPNPCWLVVSLYTSETYDFVIWDDSSQLNGTKTCSKPPTSLFALQSSVLLGHSHQFLFWIIPLNMFFRSWDTNLFHAGIEWSLLTRKLCYTQSRFTRQWYTIKGVTNQPRFWAGAFQQTTVCNLEMVHVLYFSVKKKKFTDAQINLIRKPKLIGLLNGDTMS